LATVTICVPTYQRPELLEVALRSALKQTFQDFVILIGDNGSLPATQDVVAKLNDTRITHVRHTENLGMMGNWVWLMNQAKTPYAASLHDDDIWEPTFLEKTIAAFELHPKVSMVFTGHTLIDESGQELPEETTKRAHDLYEGLKPGIQSLDPSDTLHRAFVRNAPQPAYAAALRTSAVQAIEFPVEAGPVYDLWLTYNLGRLGHEFFYIPERLTRYRTWPGSATKSGIMANSEDWLFQLVLDNEHDARPAVLTQIRQRWAALRFSRAMALIGAPSTRKTAGNLLRESAPHLSGAQRAVAKIGGSNPLALEVLGLAQKGRSLVRKS
jgi:glycosyltransferase involved in cell wall biosynthesis